MGLTGRFLTASVLVNIACVYDLCWDNDGTNWDWAQGQMSQGWTVEIFVRKLRRPGMVPFHISLVVSLIFSFLSRVSGSLPIRDGGIPRWGAIDLQIDDHLLEFSAIGLAHLVFHEGLRTLIPHFVVQNGHRVAHI